MTRAAALTAVTPPPSEDIEAQLERRLGRLHAHQRLGIERHHEAQIFGQGLRFFHFENLLFSHFLIEAALRLSGLYWQGRRNAAKIELRYNEIFSPRLPEEFDGYLILHLSDLHWDMSEPAMEALLGLLPRIDYNLCVITGDYRGKTAGPFDRALAGMARLGAALTTPVYGVLGNHDTIRMVPGLEKIGIRMLLNESVVIEHGRQRIYVSGVDDAHFYRVDNLEKAAADIPRDAFSIILTHTPEIYLQCAHAGFDVLFSGHTHGGQICLPGGIPLTLDSPLLPRAYGSGAWRYKNMAGYTSAGAGSSVAPVRFNCPPEITLHRLCLKRREEASVRAVSQVQRVKRPR
ncbi:MAG TPA: metallophosphoesterase [Methylocella sp.]|nr:metallophosphoesterase [Methylocella sp.]